MAKTQLEKAQAGYFYEGPGTLFTDDEVAERSNDERRKNVDALDAVRAAGFLRYPLFATTIDGQSTEKEAWVHPSFEPSCSLGFFEKHGMRYNIYIPSYERAGTAGTMKMLDEFGVANYYICIDPAQFEKYSAVYPLERLVVRDISFREADMLDPSSGLQLPITMAGHAPLTNFTLALSRSMGESHFWFMDDDISNLAVKARRTDCDFADDEPYDRAKYHRVSRLTEDLGFDFSTFMHRIEDVMLVIRNPGFVGLEKFGMVYSSQVKWRTGTRVYSYYLTSNETQVTHYGRQNNDVITSLELTKNGLVNLLHLGVSYNSEPTQVGTGGQSLLYKALGTADKGRVLCRAQPAHSKIAFKFNRIHHEGIFRHGTAQRVVGRVIER